MTLTLPMCFVCQIFIFIYIYIYVCVFIDDLTGQTSLCTHTAFRLPCPALTSQISLCLCKSHPFTLKRARMRTFSDIWSFRNKSPDRTLPFWKNFTFAAGLLSWQGSARSHMKRLAKQTWLKQSIRILRWTKACVKAMAETVPLSSSEPDFIWFDIYTSSTAQGGGGSFKNRKPIGEVGCCESGMAERSHWWTERCLRSPLFLSLSLTIYLPTYLSIYLCIYLSIDLSLSLSSI